MAVSPDPIKPITEREFGSEVEPRDEPYRKWIFTIPNVICMFRLIGSVGLLVLALCGLKIWFVGLFIGLTLSDWIDGRLARWLHQRSDFGARLDSFADAALYTALLIGLAVLCWSEVVAEAAWLVPAIASYFLTTLAGIIKYRRVPSYHTWAAKKSQGIVLLAGIALVLGWATWPLRVAAVAAIATNIEATLMTVMLPTWQADVSSLWKVLRQKKSENSL